MILGLAISLLLTITIELSISLMLGINSHNDIRTIILVNICTNPIVVYIAKILKLLNNNIVYILILVLLEIIVVIVEFKLYNKYLKDYEKSKVILSLVNNMSSYLIGVLINIIL